MTAAPSAPLRSIEGQSGFRPAACGMLPGTKWVWISMASATTRFLDIVMHRTNSPATFSGGTYDVTLQAGWTVFNMDAIEE
jgi:hypothetical protein